MLFHKLLPYALYPVTWIGLLLLLAFWCCWRSRRRAALWAMGASLVLLGTAASPGVANFLWASLERQFPPQPLEQLPTSGAIVLLGGGIELPAPPRVMPELNDAADRVWMAAELYHAGKAPFIVVSGGQVFADPSLLTEADYHVQLLRRMGVPAQAIVLETGSSNTADNAVLTAKLLEARAITDILLVTSAMHLPRATLLFRQAGLTVVPAACDVRIAAEKQPAILNWLPSGHAFATTEVALREWLGLTLYRLRALGK